MLFPTHWKEPLTTVKMPLPVKTISIAPSLPHISCVVACLSNSIKFFIAIAVWTKKICNFKKLLLKKTNPPLDPPQRGSTARGGAYNNNNVVI